MAERDVDLLERLQSLNPVAAGALDDLVLSEPALALFERIVADDRAAGGQTLRGPRPAAGPQGWRRPRAVRLAVTAAAVTVSVGAAGYALVARQGGGEVVACFASADLRADTAVVGLDGEDPVATCGELWTQGAFGFLATPALRGCVLESGVVGVFPEAGGRDACRDLGLAAMVAPDEGPAPDETARFVAFRETVQARFVGQACFGAEAATAIVREELQRAGLGGWAVVTAADSSFSAERPCAGLAFFPDERTVTFVPVPVPPAG